MPHRSVPISPPPAAAVISLSPGDSAGGYRIVRRLGEGARAEVLLGFGLSGETGGEIGGETGGDPNVQSTAAVKVYRAGVQNTQIEREALARLEHPHLLRLLDVSSLPGGSSMLVVERLEGGSLAQLLDRRRTLALGEIVTILAPIAEAVDAMHAAGVIHGAITPRSILFRGSGAPVLACFGRAILADPARPEARLEQDPGVVSDRAALSGLARLMLERVPDSDEDAVRSWVAGDDPGGDPHEERGVTLALRLFDLAEPAPVRFADTPASEPGNSVPSRLGRLEPSSQAEDGPAVADRPLAARVGTAVDRVIDQARRVRTPIWVAAASVAIAVIAALFVVPSVAEPVKEPSSASSVPPNSAPPSNVPPSSVPTTTGSAPQADGADPSLTGDDPAAAVGALIAARSACLAQLSVQCLAGVDQPESAALESDASLVRGIAAGGETPAGSAFAAGKTAVLQRLGDSVLVSLGRTAHSKPAYVLVIRTEAGWRIRDYLN